MHFYFTWYLTQSKALRRCSVNPSYPLYAISMVAWAGGLAESAFIFYPMELITQCVAIFKLHFYNTATTGPFYLTYVGEHSFWISIQAAWIGRKQLSFRIWNCDICGIFCLFTGTVNSGMATCMGFPGSSAGKEPTYSARDLGLIPVLEDPLEKGTATHSSILGLPWWIRQ